MRATSQFPLILFALSSLHQLEGSQVKRRFQRHATQSRVQGRVQETSDILCLDSPRSNRIDNSATHVPPQVACREVH